MALKVNLMALKDFCSPRYWCEKSSSKGKVVRVEQNSFHRAGKATHKPQTHTLLLLKQISFSTSGHQDQPLRASTFLLPQGRRSPFYLPLSIISLLKKTPAACQQHFPAPCGCPLSSPRPQEQNEGTCRVHCVPVPEARHNPPTAANPTERSHSRKK